MKEIIDRLAKSYIPEWRIDWGNKDAGAVLAEIFAKQMEENEEAYNAAKNMPGERLAELIDISLKPPRPSSVLIHMKVSEGMTEGIKINKGTKLYGTSEDGERIIFETVREMQISSAAIKNIFAEKGSRGIIMPVEGDFNISGWEAYDYDTDCKDIYERQEIIIDHPFIFKGEGQVFSLKTDCREFVKYVNNGKLEICAVSNTGARPVNILRADGTEIMFDINFERTRDDLIIIRKKAEIENPLSAAYIYLSSATPDLAPDFVRNPLMDCDVNKFYPFGEIFSLFDECILGQSLCFSKKEALITISFELSYKKIYSGVEESSPQKLPLIKRRRKYETEQSPKEVFADKILLEYNSPKGWKRIETAEPVENIFEKEFEGIKNIKFYCPDDWGNSEEGEGCLLRLQLIGAKNCYEQRCIYHAPIIKNMRISYSYDNVICTPQSLTAICGINIKTYNSRDFLKDNEKWLFCADKAGGDIYICFDKKIEAGPVGMYVQCEGEPVKDEDIEYLYYGQGGFKPLYSDLGGVKTGKGGVIIFNVPKDMEEMDYCGIRGFFIKIRQRSAPYKRNWSVTMNVVEAQNIDTCMEEDYYIEEIKAGMKVLVHDRDILKIDLWMDETKEYLRALGRKEEFAAGMKIRTEKDESGQISRVMVLWRETPSFEAEDNGSRVYMLDRESNAIIFGDGIRQRLPSEKERPAFRAAVYKSRGSRGNLPAGAVTDTISNILFLDSMRNITEGKGGTDRETEEEKRKRAYMLIRNHRRLVTDKDYYYEIMSYSSLICRAKTVWKGGRLYAYILTHDFNQKKGSFNAIKDGLKEHLLDRGDILTGSEDIIIEEPVYVGISVEIWYEPVKGAELSYVNKLFENSMKKYLDPICGGRGGGWKIGTLPIITHIMMQLECIREWGLVRSLSVTASYESNGIKKECGLEKLEKSAAMIPVSGNHCMHVVQAGHKNTAED